MGKSENASKTPLAQVSEKQSSQAPRPLQCKEETEGCSKMDAIRQMKQKGRGAFKHTNVNFKNSKDC